MHKSRMVDFGSVPIPWLKCWLKLILVGLYQVWFSVCDIMIKKMQLDVEVSPPAFVMALPELECTCSAV